MEEIQNPTGEIVEAAALQQNSSPSSDNQSEQVVPVHVVQSLRGENQQLKENLKMVAEHLELLKANRQKPEEQPSQGQFSKFNDDDVLTVGEAKKVVQDLQRQYQMSIEELKISQMCPDYVDIVKKYLPQVLKEDPDLRYEIENARNPYKMAYYLAKKSESYLEDSKAKQKNSDAQKILNNSQKSGSLSAIGGTSPISQASHWKSMNDEEFRKIMNKNMGHF